MWTAFLVYNTFELVACILLFVNKYKARVPMGVFDHD